MLLNLLTGKENELTLKNECVVALASVAQLVGASFCNLRIAFDSWFDLPTGHGHVQPSLRICTIPSPGTFGRQLVNASLSHKCFSLSLPLSLKAMKKCPQVRVLKNECVE